MKNLPRTAKLLLIPAACVVGIFAFQALASEKPATDDVNAPFILSFNGPVQITAEKEKFEKALKAHTKDGNTYRATYDGVEIPPPTLGQMKTEKVTRTEATPRPAATAAASGVNVTQRAGFADLKKLDDFVKAIK